MIPFSILDLSPIAEGSTAGEALRRSMDLAQLAEKLGYHRYWVAEHHNMPGIASAATAVVIGYLASGTRTIRLGSGGVMLPNHSPLVIAEQFGTLASLYPGRIDLGLGRAPGTDFATARALRRDPETSADRFPQDVRELQRYLDRPHAEDRIRAIPGQGTEVPIWLLGSSLFSAQLAAQYGLPFAFAAHFAPGDLADAFAVYRQSFQPSESLKASYAMLTINVFAGATDAEARRDFSSVQQSFANLRSGRPGPLPPPVEDWAAQASPFERAQVQQALAGSIVGGPETVRRGLREILDNFRPDEIMVAGHFYDHAARRASFTRLADIFKSLDWEASPDRRRLAS